MMARSLGVFLLFFFVVTCGVSQYTSIFSVKDFMEFVSKANESTGPFGGTVFLGVDIDLSGKQFSPIGLRDDGGCNAFTGTLVGYPDIKVIRGAKVENTRDAGLFCRLEGATVANLHLDSSCNFTGRRVGAISASASNVNLWEVSSEATIVGVTKNNDNHAKTGGLIGVISDNTESTVSMISCTCNGTINHTIGVDNHVLNTGGFIGEVKNNTKVSINVVNSQSDVLFANIKGSFTGGLVGNIESNRYLELRINNFTNNGNIAAEGRVTLTAGGVVGQISEVDDLNALIVNSTNHVNISAITPSSAILGGFIGYVTKSHGSLIIGNCVNNGVIISTDEALTQTFLGGIVGAIYETSTSRTNLKLNNVANRGALTSSKGTVCGLACQNQVGSSVIITVRNSINRANLSGMTAFGITNSDDSESGMLNVVNLGVVNGTSNSDCLWGKEMEAYSVFVLDGACKKSGDLTKVFSRDNSDGVFRTLDTKEDVQELLNQVAMDQDCGMGWISELELVYPYTITVSGVVNNSTFALPGERLADVPLLRQYFTTRFVIIDNSTKTACNTSTVATGDMQLVISAASTIEIVIDPSSEFDKDKIKIDIEDELKDMGYVIGDVTVREDDGKLVVSVIVADQDSGRVVESLRGCISSSSM